VADELRLNTEHLFDEHNSGHSLLFLNGHGGHHPRLDVTDVDEAVATRTLADRERLQQCRQVRLGHYDHVMTSQTRSKLMDRDSVSAFDCCGEWKPRFSSRDRSEERDEGAASGLSPMARAPASSYVFVNVTHRASENVGGGAP
jgi:hypothetical protein